MRKYIFGLLAGDAELATKVFNLIKVRAEAVAQNETNKALEASLNYGKSNLYVLRSQYAENKAIFTAALDLNLD